MGGNRRLATLVAAAAAMMPMAACAKGGGQGNGQATAGGMTLAQFEARRGGRLMAADSDGDGRVSRAEFTAAQQGKGDPARRFDRLDANRDGVLDKGEIDAMLARRFHRMDANGDGLVTRDERAAMRQKGGPASGGDEGPAPDGAAAGSQ